MQLIKQLESLSVNNVDLKLSANLSSTDVANKHGTLLPASIRCIICGPSNCGKTNVMMSLIEHPNGLKFRNIYVYSKSLHQPKYEYLKNIISSITGLGFYEFANNADVIPPEAAKPDSIFIFDDVACDKQNNIRAYFCMGRHNKIDSFYLCQSYGRVPKHLIRDNANFLILFKQDDMNLQHIYNDHVNTDMSLNEFCNICNECWRGDKYGFLVIDKDRTLNEGRFRKGFDVFIKI